MQYRQPKVSLSSSSPGPSYPRQGSGRFNGTCQRKPHGAGPKPRQPRGSVKWDASAPVHSTRTTGGDHRRQQADPPLGNNLNNYNSRNTSYPNGAAHNPRGQGCQPRPSYNNRRHCHPNGSDPTRQPSHQPRYPSHLPPRHPPRQLPRSNQGICKRRNPRIDHDGDWTMSGMPFIYTKQQWKNIQTFITKREQSEREQQKFEQDFQSMALDPLMTDAPAPGHGHPSQVLSDVMMLDLPDDF